MRADSVSVAFDLFVTPSHKVEKAVFPPFDQVSRVHHAIKGRQFRRCERIWLVHGAGFLLVAPKAERHGRPSMDQLPFFARQAFLAALVEDPDVGIGDRATDARWSSINVFRRQICGPKRLGQAVHQVKLCAGQQGPELLEVRLRNHSPRIRDVPQL